MSRHTILQTILLCTLLLCGCKPELPGPTIWIDRPLDGDKFPLEPITILAHASDADGVARIEFLIGYELLGTVAGGGTRFAEATAGWSPSAPGVYTIRARAVDASGSTGPDAVARITIGEMPPAPTTRPTAAPPPTPAPTLSAPPSPSVHPEVQITFAAERDGLRQGECTTLRWSIAGGYQFEINNEIVSRAGQMHVCPAQTTTYRLAVDEGERWVHREVTVQVAAALPTSLPQPTSPPPPPPVCPGPPVIASFTAHPGTLTAGQASTLSWGAVTNATTASIDPDIGGVGTPGSRVVSPATTTTYTLTATGCGGTTRKQVTVVVQAPLPVVTLIPIDRSAPAISNPSVSPSSVSRHGCGATTMATVSAMVTDAGGVNRVVARLGGIGSGEVAMSPVGGNVYRAQVGSFNVLGQLTIQVVAWDKAGNMAQSGSLSVSVVCIQ